MATSRDVARIAGVSQATVSRALSNGKVSAATRKKIMEAAASVGYVPNLGARAMKTGRVETIGVVVADLTNPFYPEILGALTEYLDKAGQKVTLWNSDGPGNDAALEAINAGSIDGIIFTTVTEASAPLRAALAKRSPVVLINRVVETLQCDQVASDNATGGSAIADYLLANGHTEIALIGGPPAASTARDRTRGFTQRLLESGAPLRADRIVEGTSFSHDYGYTATKTLLESPDRPTAIFCSNDLIAFGALDAARAVKVAVPEDLWIVGYDDIAMGAWPAFDLTTMHQPTRTMAEAGAEALLERIENPDAPYKTLTFRSHLVPRGSTACTPVSAPPSEAAAVDSAGRRY
ncbi:LacI family transcriptional regulator [Rhodococcus sp. IEGM 248]|uniref:LacI family DNA-binding transcriptional regulator n=1 Tax=Rhodococcus opacus TaxID=37919 RepID=UPI0013C093D5|nr:LacI family DNA-binding transcriptional regulator [Rhodococcus opacus]MDV7090898.1 LacI family DNA-binding transcriptional regulator [Rhodococcus opacus]NDV10951.1 LacI family transcriptional regulator [Rhodococcus sp. IEGM 248]